MLKKYFKNPSVLSITALILYIAGLTAYVLKLRYVDKLFLEYHLPSDLLHISSYVVVTVFCVLYDKSIISNPRSVVFAFFVSEIVTALICTLALDCNTQIIGAYRVAQLLGLDYGLMDAVILYIQGMIAALIPFIKGKIVTLYLKIACLMYFACMAVTPVLSLINYYAIDAYPFLFLLSAVTLNYAVIQAAKRFNNENIGGAWAGILEDERGEYYYDDYDERGVDR